MGNQSIMKERGMDPIKVRLGAEVERLAGDLNAASEFLYNNPEIGYQEFKGCEYLSRFLREHGFEVELIRSRFWVG